MSPVWKAACHHSGGKEFHLANSGPCRSARPDRVRPDHIHKFLGRNCGCEILCCSGTWRSRLTWKRSDWPGRCDSAASEPLILAAESPLGDHPPFVEG